MANSVDPDQTAPIGAVCSGSTLFASILNSSVMLEGAQWLSGRVLDLRPKGCGFQSHRRHYFVSLSKNINPSLVLVQPRKTLPL